MSLAHVGFLKIVQDVQGLAGIDPNDNLMRSTIHFTLSVDGRYFGPQFVIVSQPRGSNYNTEPIEVGPVQGSYSGLPWNANQFADIAEDYYRQGIGLMVQIGPGVRNLTMRNNSITFTGDVEFEVPSTGSRAWSPK